MFSQILTGLAFASHVFGATISLREATRDSCPGYTASNVASTSTGLTADLTLAGPACNIYGKDVHDLKLIVNYDSGNSICGFGYQILTS